MGPEAANSPPIRILFVCSGNICRSPLAEALFKSMAKEAGVLSRFEVDSAGTHNYHEGDQADPRTRRVGRQHGLVVDSIARPVIDSDFDRFDYIIAMDRGHRRELMARAGRGRSASIRMMREFDPGAPSPDVADPYYGGEDGFENMYLTLQPACRGLLETLRLTPPDSSRGEA
jgi:protein-tyrosine phosphatase